MNLVKRLILLMAILASTEANASQSIWSSTDRGPVLGTYRVPVDISSSSTPGQISASELQSFIFVAGVAPGDLAYFNGTAWVILSHGTSGTVLTSQGAAAPTWSASSGSGTVTTTGSPSSGNLAFFSGGTSITSGNLSGDCTTSGTGLTSCLKTGGVLFGSLATSSATLPVNTNSVSHQWLAAYNSTTGAFTQSQPAFSDVSGTAQVAQGGTGVTAGQGNGTKVQLSTGTTTTNDCVKFDANGNTVDAGAACGSGGGSGTVSSVSVVTANGMAGTVANATTTPAITLTTNITGLMKGNGTAISAATAGTDYVAPGGALGTPSSGIATNITGLPLTTGVTGVLPTANGGTTVPNAFTATGNLNVINASNLSGGNQVLDYLAPPGDVVSSCAAGYGLIRINSTYTGAPIQMRVTQNGSPVLQNIPFKDNFVDIEIADQFAQTRDVGTTPDIRFYDQCGSGYDSAFVSSLPGPRWTFGESSINGLRTVVWDDVDGAESAGGSQGLSIPTLALNEDAYSFAYIGQTASALPHFATELAELEPVGSRIEHTIYAAAVGGSSGGYGLSAYVAAITGFASPTILMNSADAGLRLFVSGATSYSIYDNSIVSTGSKTTWSTTSAGAQLGYSSNSAVHSSQMNALAFIFWNKTLSSTDIPNLQNYSSTVVGGTAGTNTPALWGIGDSTLNSTHESNNNVWLADVKNAMNTKFNFYLDAYSGTTAALLNTNLSVVTGNKKAGVTNAVFIQAGYNDVGGGATVSAAVATLTGMCDTLHTAGFTPVIVVPSQLTTSNGLMTPSLQNTLWTTLASSISGHCDAISQNWSDNTIGFTGNPANTVYYYSDQIHMTPAGHRIMAMYALQALKQFVQ